MAEPPNINTNLLKPNPQYAVFTKLFPYQRHSDGFWAFLSRVPPTVGDERITDEEKQTWNYTHYRPESVPPWPSDEDFVDKFPADMESWKEDGIEADVYRILRGAVQANRPSIVKFLLDMTHADLLSRDVLDRTALFYAVLTTAPIQILDLVVDAIHDTSIVDRELIRSDLQGNTAVSYAARSDHWDVLETVLLHISDPELRGKVAAETLKLHTERHWVARENDFTLLLYGQLQEYFEFPVYIEHNSNIAEDEMIRGVFSIMELRSHLKSLGRFLKTKRYSDAAPNSIIWLHLPWNNGILLHTLYTTVQKHLETRETKVNSPIEHEACRRTFLRSFLNMSIKPATRWLQARAPACEFFDNTEVARVAEDSATGSVNNAMRSAAIVFPYMTLESWSLTFDKVRRDHIELCASLPRLDLVNQVHTGRTLDEAHYPSLSAHVLDEYNKEQVVTRECRTNSEGADMPLGQRPILMVSSLWIWRFGNYIISSQAVPDAAPKDLLQRYQNPLSQELLELELKLNNDAISDAEKAQLQKIRTLSAYRADAWRPDFVGPESRIRSSEPDIQLGALMAMQVETFGKPKPRLDFQSPLDYFEIGVARVMSDVDEYTRKADTESLDIKKEETFLREISDIRGELMTVDEVLIQQQEILEDFVAGAEPSAKSHRLFGRVIAAQKQLTGYRKRVAKIERDAERIDSMINAALDLKRTHASIQDARASLQDARSSLLLGWAVMGFTVITVLFAPIAFMTALFALPIDHLLKNQLNGTDAAGEPVSVYTSGYVTWTFFVAEISALIITALAIWGALQLRDWIRPGATAQEIKHEKLPVKPTAPASKGDNATSVGSEPSGMRQRWRAREGKQKEEV